MGAVQGSCSLRLQPLMSRAVNGSLYCKVNINALFWEWNTSVYIVSLSKVLKYVSPRTTSERNRTLLLMFVLWLGILGKLPLWVWWASEHNSTFPHCPPYLWLHNSGIRNFFLHGNSWWIHTHFSTQWKKQRHKKAALIAPRLDSSLPPTEACLGYEVINPTLSMLEWSLIHVWNLYRQREVHWRTNKTGSLSISSFYIFTHWVQSGGKLSYIV